MNCVRFRIEGRLQKDKKVHEREAEAMVQALLDQISK